MFGIISVFLNELWFHFFRSNTFILIAVAWEQFWISLILFCEALGHLRGEGRQKLGTGECTFGGKVLDFHMRVGCEG